MKQRLLIFASLAAGIGGAGLWVVRAQEPQDQLTVQHADCTLFGPQRDRFTPRNTTDRFRRSHLTEQVTAMLASAPQAAAQPTDDAAASMPSAPGGSRTFTKGQSVGSTSGNLIDVFIFQAFKQKGVKPAEKTDDYEFIRRVTLDLTGRIPSADRVVSFVADTTPDKRKNLINELMAKPEWLDKWTMFYGDLFRNASAFPNTGVAQNTQGRDAFNHWIRDSLFNNKPYNQMATELIASVGTNSTVQGELNWMNNGRVANVNLAQDDWDQQTANVAETFLGIAHMNCLLCHK